jgi:large subunit ribosomal protein L23
MEKTTLLKPRLSEKTFGLAKDTTVYVFDVPTGANKQTVAAAVTAQFDVTVIRVNILNLKGKAKRTVRKGGRAVSGSQSDRRKAYVTLKEGDKLPFFETEEKEEKKAAKSSASSSAQATDDKKATEGRKKSIFSRAKKSKKEEK